MNISLQIVRTEPLIIVLISVNWTETDDITKENLPEEPDYSLLYLVLHFHLSTAALQSMSFFTSITLDSRDLCSIDAREST